MQILDEWAPAATSPRPRTVLVTVARVAYPALGGLGNETFLRGSCPGYLTTDCIHQPLPGSHGDAIKGNTKRRGAVPSLVLTLTRTVAAT